MQLTMVKKAPWEKWQLQLLKYIIKSDRFWICSFFQVPCESHYHHFFICRGQTLSLLWIMSAIFHQTHAILLGDTLQQVFTSSIWCFTHLLELSYLKHIEFAQTTEVVRRDGRHSLKYVHSSWLDKCPFDTEWKFFSWEGSRIPYYLSL